MARSIVWLPDDIDVHESYQVYLNGVPQEGDVDFRRHGRALVLERPPRRDRISGRRWLLGAWGVGTPRHDHALDLGYETDGEPHFAYALAITAADESRMTTVTRARSTVAVGPSRGRALWDGP